MFQYISCYSLSNIQGFSRYIKIRFQYISCYSLSCGVGVVLICSICFNTSHVTLYRSAGSTDGFPVSVSIHLMLLFIQNRGLNFNLPIRFNTSHVTLYLSGLLRRFKPIGCFNTSHVTLYQNTISGSPAIRPSFNTSHVTLYPSSETTCISRYRGFNTSHVTLYRERRGRRFHRTGVSIHLMLLFIFTPLQIMLARLAFQYISCYSLSP